jgi:hypothetical protein
MFLLIVIFFFYINIQVMTPARRNQVRRILSLGNGDSMTSSSNSSRTGGGGGGQESSGSGGMRSGVTPGFVFLQLCAQGVIGRGERPILLPSEESTTRSLKV